MARAFALAILMGVASVCSAQWPDEPDRLHGFVGIGLTAGGDRLATVDVVTFNDHSDERDLHAGEVMTLTGGLIAPIAPLLTAQFSIGYHTDRVSAGNDSVWFDRFPLEFIPFYNLGRHRFGAGISYHLDPELNLRDAGGPRVDFDNALGWLVEYDFHFVGWGSSGPVLGVRYMWIDYEIDAVDGSSVPGGSDVEGDHIGVHFDWVF